MNLIHREAMTNGVYSADRPRGLHADMFGPNGLGVSALADRLRPIDATAVFLWCPWGIERDGSISDRPFERATEDHNAGDLPSEWFRRLCNLDEWAATLARIKVRGRRIGIHIGCPTSDTPDAGILALAKAGLIDFISWDASAHQPESVLRAQWNAYSDAGVRQHGYEAFPNNRAGHLWGDPNRVLVTTLDGFKASQERVARQPYHPDINVHADMVQGPILILDVRDNVQGSLDHMSKGRDVAANLLAPAWRDHLAKSAPADHGDDGDADGGAS